MSFELIDFTAGALVQKQAVGAIMRTNDYTGRYGLRLTPEQAHELVETRAQSLSANGRVEFGGGVIDRIIHAFCDSSYIRQSDYAQTLHDLIEMFYYYKNETLDLIGDDELIAFMKAAFDGSCHGSLALLADRELYTLARDLRFGYAAGMPDADDPEWEEESDV